MDLIQLRIPRSEANSCKNQTKLIQQLKLKKSNKLPHLLSQIQFTVLEMDVQDTMMMDLLAKNVHLHPQLLMAIQSIIQFQNQALIKISLIHNLMKNKLLMVNGLQNLLKLQVHLLLKKKSLRPKLKLALKLTST